MIIQEALAYGRNQLTHSPSPLLDARLLLQFVLGKNHPYLVAHSDETLTAEQQKSYQQLIERAAEQEPVPYLTGQVPFFGRLFHVNPAVLIPRPETEQLVETAIDWAKEQSALTIVDVGTGSGCIAISLALSLPQATLHAVDISEPALTVARKNAKTHHAIEQIHFHLGSLLEPIDDIPELIVANLPYITNDEWTSLSDGVKSYEPATALKGGQDGLDLIKQLLLQAKQTLAPEGAIFLEIGWKQGPAALNLAQSHFPDSQVNLSADFAGNDRIISIT